MAGKDDDILRVADADELIDRGLRADEEQDLDLAERILDEAGDRLGENHPRVLHLAGRIAWANGDLERAAGFFQQAADRKPARADIYIDGARCIYLLSEDDGNAEALLRAALALSGLDEVQEGDARVLLARIRLDDEDPEEALELLDEIPDGLKSQALYLSARADVLVELDHPEEALRCIDRAVAAEPDDPDYAYQQGLLRQSMGDVEGGAESMLRVAELDAAVRGSSSELSAVENRELREALEGAMEELPDPLLKLVASVPISVQARATAEQIRAGADPRSAVFFEGQPQLDDQDAELRRIVVARDIVLDEADDEEDLEEVLLVALVGEIADFFRRDDLVYEGVAS